MIRWLVILSCWTVSFVYAGIEAGLLSLDPVRLRHQVKLRDRSAMLLDRLLKKPERLLVTILLVTNFADIAGLLLLTRRLVHSLGAPGYVVALLLAAPIYLFMLGVLPKSLFRRFPYRALANFAGLLELTSRIFWPVLEIGALASRSFIGKKTAAPRIFAAREDLKQLTVEGERQGAITSAERAMIHNVVDFRLVKVRDVMRALGEVVSAPPEASVDDLLQLHARTGVDRVPIISRDGAPVGLVNVFEILLDPRARRGVGDYMRRLVTATENESAYRIIRRLRAARLTLAAVVDRQNQLRGIVTVEDLIRRLVQSA
ncbi:MAG TPA: CNNM domain-containing protein [Chthoniobacterales bacterium]|jgi:CBS domain containing-hemolysin-like protein